MEISIKFTSLSSFIFLVWIINTSNQPFSSGTPISISLSNLPNLLKAGSIELGLLVAPIIITYPLPFNPSINVNN